MAATPRSERIDHEHFVQFFETDAFLINSVSEFIGSGLRAGETGVVIATRSRRKSLEEQLQVCGLEIAAARERGQYLSIDAATTLSQFMDDGSPEPGRFAEVVGSIIARAAQGRRRVRIFGEMVALLWADGNRAAAIRLEELWNDLARTYSFSLFCTYPLQGFGGEVYELEFNEICRQHSHVIPSESYAALASEDERLRAIALLQQKAASLEIEIAERKLVEEALRESEARKDEFISIAGHEFKTPITSIKGFTQVLHRRFKKRDDEESVRVLAIMDTQLNKLTKMISDLLDFSKMQQGKLTYQEECFALDALVQETVADLQRTTQTHRLVLESAIQTQVHGDRDRIRQVLIHLLTNALKYSPQADKVIVRVSTHAENVYVSVQDYGIGIAESHHEKIFQRFYQVTGPEEKTYPGLGIGLYLSNEIIKHHHGQMSVESTKGNGSTFSFSLPLAEMMTPFHE